MATTIQVSEELQEKLKDKKFFEKESYEEVIWDLLEDSITVSEQTKRDIRQSEKELREGKIHTLEEVKKELSI